MQKNEYLVRISGKVAIEPSELELGKELDLVIKGSVVEVRHQDTQEGTEDIIYVIKPIEAKLK